MLELWGAEYQESNALLLHPSDRSFLESVCQREKCPVDFVGNITGDGKVPTFTSATQLVIDWTKLQGTLLYTISLFFPFYNIFMNFYSSILF